MKKQLKVEVYNINEICEKVLLNANSVCGFNNVGDEIGPCSDLSPQMNNCAFNVVEVCYDFPACGFLVMVR